MERPMTCEFNECDRIADRWVVIPLPLLRQGSIKVVDETGSQETRIHLNSLKNVCGFCSYHTDWLLRVLPEIRDVTLNL